MELQGGCSCGAIRYTFNQQPMFAQACHCTDCQRLSGSAFLVNLWIELDQIEIESGVPAKASLLAGSGQPHDVYYCKDCGTQLWSHYHAAMPDVRFVRAGTLDDPSLAPPKAHVFVQSKQDWLSLSDDLPKFDTFYSMKELWPAASLERIRALKSRASSD